MKKYTRPTINLIKVCPLEILAGTTFDTNHDFGTSGKTNEGDIVVNSRRNDDFIFDDEDYDDNEKYESKWGSLYW